MSPEDRESIADATSVYSVDDEDQLSPEDTLDDDPTDPLDRGYHSPDRLVGSVAYGVTTREQRGHETIDQRIRQEESDPCSGYGAPPHPSSAGRGAQGSERHTDSPETGAIHLVSDVAADKLID